MYNYLDIICLGEKSDSVEGGVQERAQQAGLPGAHRGGWSARLETTNHLTLWYSYLYVSYFHIFLPCLVNTKHLTMKVSRALVILPGREIFLTYSIGHWHERAAFQRSAFGRSTAGNDVVVAIIISLFFSFWPFLVIFDRIMIFILGAPKKSIHKIKAFLQNSWTGISSKKYCRNTLGRPQA